MRGGGDFRPVDNVLFGVAGVAPRDEGDCLGREAPGPEKDALQVPSALRERLEMYLLGRSRGGSEPRDVRWYQDLVLRGVWCYAEIAYDATRNCA